MTKMIRFEDLWDLAQRPEDAKDHLKQQVLDAVQVLASPALSAALCEELAQEARQAGPRAVAQWDAALGTCQLVAVSLAWAEQDPEGEA
jgi:non-ribosomal peptide synthetase component F